MSRQFEFVDIFGGGGVVLSLVSIKLQFMGLAGFTKNNNSYVRELSGGYVLSNLKTLLSKADEVGFGVMACNVRSGFILNAILEAAWLSYSPVICEIAESETGYCCMPPDRLSDLLHEGCERMIKKYSYSVPVCLHYDHIQKNVDDCVDKAIRFGFSSVEIDLSKMPLDLNIEKCKEVASKVYPLGISLEVEDGEIGNASALADPEVEKNIENYYSMADDCKRLVEETGAQAIAFFVGNGHGNYLKKPIIGFDRIKEICDTVRPLGAFGVMHGGSGLSKEDFNKCVKMGARKFNYATAISDIWFKYFPDNLIENMNEKAEEMGLPLRKVLYLYEDDWKKLDFSEAEREMTEHISFMMKNAFFSEGKSKLYE